MENENIYYYNGTSTRPSLVRVLVFHNQLHLHRDDDSAFYEVFPVSIAYSNAIGSTRYLYLDKAGLKYLKYSVNHPLAGVLHVEVEKNKGNWAQKLLKQRFVVLVSILLLLGIGIYFSAVNLIPIIGMRIIGVEQEIKLGDKLKDLTLQETTVFGKDVVDSKLIQHFANQLKLSDTYPIRVTLVNSDIVNAYALPGGNVVVYKGILNKINTPEQLTALLAHESSHINQRHTLRSLLRSAANAILISIVFGDATGISGALASHAETLNGLRYSRSLETEADEKGMDLMLTNKVNVDGMRQLMQMLQKEEKMPGSFAFLSTHPLTKERIASVEKYLSKHSNMLEDRNDLEETFSKLKEKIK